MLYKKNFDLFKFCSYNAKFNRRALRGVWEGAQAIQAVKNTKNFLLLSGLELSFLRSKAYEQTNKVLLL
jgi:hypothetical protein